MAPDRDVLAERRGGLLAITLNRPRALNALSLEMCRELDPLLRAAADDPKIAALTIKGAGDRAFCAGGDIRRLYDAGRAGEDYPANFYHDEYRLNARVYHFPKPYVALMDGIVMGGGVGLSVHGSHRIVSERLTFAMPETGIGLFPDVGGSHFLARCPGRIGLFLALTGARLKAADAIFAGVGDAYVPSARLAAFEAALAEGGAIEPTLAAFRENLGESELAARRADIDRLFAGDSVEAILAALDASGDDWAAKQAATIRTKSPTSLKIAHRQIGEGAGRRFTACMAMEYRIANACIRGHDFYEGVRAVVIDKDQAPVWRPDRLDAIGDEDIAAYFDTVPPSGDLTFPDLIEQRDD